MEVATEGLFRPSPARDTMHVIAVRKNLVRSFRLRVR